MDWQSTELRPLFDHARQPFFLDYRGPQVTGLDPPPFPDDIDRLKSPEEHSVSVSQYVSCGIVQDIDARNEQETPSRHGISGDSELRHAAAGAESVHRRRGAVPILRDRVGERMGRSS